MSIFRKFLCLFLAVLVLSLPVQTSAAGEDTEAYIQRMLQYYLTYQEKAEDEIGFLLDYLSELDPETGDRWRKIMVSWAFHNSRMELNRGILPDGLPQDDSLAIVIMGYGLRADGTMREELIDRLVVGLSSALKYPNAYVVVTGGATSALDGVTEAGQMARWLRERGIGAERLIVENKAMSTIQNARRVCRIMEESYPQVRSVAVVTSDYHIRQSCTMFSTAFHNEGLPVKVVSNAVNHTGKTVDDLYTQAWGICSITGIPFDAEPETQPELSE